MGRTIDITKRQNAVLKFIRSYIKKEGMPPTRGEICANFGWKSNNAAQMHLVVLERKGAIRLSADGRSRGIIVL